MKKFIAVKNKKIGEGCPVFVVAEISANHLQDFKKARMLVEAAKRCGADAVKFQAYTPDTMTLDMDNRYFRIRRGRWKGQTLHELFTKAHTPWGWFKKLKNMAEDLGLVFFCTSFDKSSVDLLEEIGVPIHKIASFELVDLPLIEYAAKTKKPLILSTGMANTPEIKEAISAARNAGSEEIMLLRCVSDYPAMPEEMNLRTIPYMRKRFGLPVGLSDHSLGIAASIAAVCLGAVMVEKHFTLSRKIKTPDSFFSMEPTEFKEMTDNIRVAEKALGKVRHGLTGDEKKNRISRRSLFVAREMKRGEIFTSENVRSIRPGHGILPKYLDDVLGAKAKNDIKCGTPLRWGLVEKRKKGTK